MGPLCYLIALKTYSILVFKVTDKDVGRHESDCERCCLHSTVIRDNEYVIVFLPHSQVPFMRNLQNRSVRNSSFCIKVKGITSDSVGSAAVKSCPDNCMV